MYVCGRRTRTATGAITFDAAAAATPDTWHDQLHVLQIPGMTSYSKYQAWPATPNTAGMTYSWCSCQLLQIPGTTSYMYSKYQAWPATPNTAGMTSYIKYQAWSTFDAAVSPLWHYRYIYSHDTTMTQTWRRTSPRHHMSPGNHHDADMTPHITTTSHVNKTPPWRRHDVSRHHGVTCHHDTNMTPHDTMASHVTMAPFDTIHDYK